MTKDIDVTAFAKRLRELRKEKQLSGEEFGKLFNVTKTAVSYWENGKTFPDNKTIIKMANFFEVSLDYLLGGVKHRTHHQKMDRPFSSVLVGLLINNIISDEPIKEISSLTGVSEDVLTSAFIGNLLDFETASRLLFCLKDLNGQDFLEFCHDTKVRRYSEVPVGIVDLMEGSINTTDITRELESKRQLQDKIDKLLKKYNIYELPPSQFDELMNETVKFLEFELYKLKNNQDK